MTIVTNRTRAGTLYVALYYCRVVRISQIESLMLLNKRNPWEYICHNGHAACLSRILYSRGSESCRKICFTSLWHVQ